jgi:hypothetical protein
MPTQPQELYFALIFGAVLLVQFLYKQVRKRPEWMQAPGGLEDSVDAGQPPSAPERTLPQARSTERPRAYFPATPSTPMIAAAQRTAYRAGGHSRRFSRFSLIPDRRAVQDAVVIATLLGPCHALRRHGSE